MPFSPAESKDHFPNPKLSLSLPLNFTVVDKSFDRTYSLELPKLPLGSSEHEFEIGDDFFGHFEFSPVKAGKVHVKAVVIKYTTHLDVTFTFDGHIQLECDRCTELYPHPIHVTQRVIFTFEDVPGLEEEHEDIKSVSREEPILPLAEEFYDFINLEAPLRKVPPTDVHLCAPEVLKLLGLDEQGNEIGGEEEEIDPRWAKLKGLIDDSEE
jgi:uncharacterized metal-binding protein YceD (DUF177 family)